MVAHTKPKQWKKEELALLLQHFGSNDELNFCSDKATIRLKISNVIGP